jgi:hypothetical protein
LGYKRLLFPQTSLCRFQSPKLPLPKLTVTMKFTMNIITSITAVLSANFTQLLRVNALPQSSAFGTVSTVMATTTVTFPALNRVNIVNDGEGGYTQVPSSSPIMSELVGYITALPSSADPALESYQTYMLAHDASAAASVEPSSTRWSNHLPHANAKRAVPSNSMTGGLTQFYNKSGQPVCPDSGHQNCRQIDTLDSWFCTGKRTSALDLNFSGICENHLLTNNKCFDLPSLLEQKITYMWRAGSFWTLGNGHPCIGYQSHDCSEGRGVLLKHGDVNGSTIFSVKCFFDPLDVPPYFRTWSSDDGTSSRSALPQNERRQVRQAARTLPYKYIHLHSTCDSSLKQHSQPIRAWMDKCKPNCWKCNPDQK